MIVVDRWQAIATVCRSCFCCSGLSMPSVLSVCTYTAANSKQAWSVILPRPRCMAPTVPPTPPPPHTPRAAVLGGEGGSGGGRPFRPGQGS